MRLRGAAELVMLTAACATAPPDRSAQELLQRFRQSVPVGASRAAFETFCSEQGLRFSCCRRNAPAYHCLPAKDGDPTSRCIAIVGGSEPTWRQPVRTDYVVEADVSDDDRISELRVAPVHTGP